MMRSILDLNGLTACGKDDEILFIIIIMFLIVLMLS
jgi:hypothetical protein